MTFFMLKSRWKTGFTLLLTICAMLTACGQQASSIVAVGQTKARITNVFLNVRGDLATYRIHLGSSNVFMEPPGRFLCIVDGSATLAMPRNLSLPFEEDHKLSQILSKAFMLANDRKIKDQSILRQFP